MKFYDLQTFDHIYKVVKWADEKQEASVDIIELNFHSNPFEHHLKHHLIYS